MKINEEFMTRLNLIGKGSSVNKKKEADLKKKKEVIDMKTTNFSNYFLVVFGWLCFGLNQFIGFLGFDIFTVVLAKSALDSVARALP